MVEAFFKIPTYILFTVMFFLIIMFNGLGYRYKKNLLAKYPDRLHESMGSIEGSILGVTSLLLGFSFSVAVAKYEARRALMISEANDIGTAILRCDLYADSIRVTLREDFKEYVEARIAYYEARYNEEKIREELQRAKEISDRIWARVAHHSKDSKFYLSSQQMIPNLNEMIDILTTRDALRVSRVPPLVLFTLLIFVFIAAFLLGSDYKGHKRNLMLLVGYALVMALTLNLINELNHPRQGLINLDQAEKKMEELRKMVE